MESILYRDLQKRCMMLGVIYLVLCMLIGKEPAGLLLSKKSG